MAHFTPLHLDATLWGEIAWQPLIAYLLIALAAAWVLRRTWRTVQRAARGGSRPGEASGGCSSCPQNIGGSEGPKAKPLVQLAPKPRGEDSRSA
ncbi:hypothetical protein [Candidatus Laterigemmans baculatus]|uniref:hypothetical protein n=1 Tax=Candidatus Laterigemmans baculatus TaxID=2770505 RepID=UPI0013D9030F|nr:hypothetical protein [Candidatus Laterigemmans baculatus]